MALTAAAPLPHALRARGTRGPTVHTIPDKPNHITPQLHVHADTEERASATLRGMGAVARALRSGADTGGADEPLTSAQEYGLAHEPLVPRNPMFSHGRNSCSITDYAAQYYAMTKQTPFSKSKRDG